MKKMIGNGINEMGNVVVKTGKALVYPYAWLIRKQAENYEKMYGDNLQYVHFWM